MNSGRLAATYILPVRGDGPAGIEELGRYLAWLNERVELIVVDGSDLKEFDRHRACWTGVRHVSPLPALRCANGKAWGAMTGFALAKNDRVVVADDDVRYDDSSLEEIVDLLDGADIVRPQNYFSPLPWHARWDTARSLINRISGGDWPGTLALRLGKTGNEVRYDGDCLFENLELVRTVRARGGQELVASGTYVRRLPPTLRRFLGQRVRQAYDEFARPRRLLMQLALLPLLVTLAASKPLMLLAAFAGSVGLAEAGRRRSGGVRVFPVSASLMAPAWVVERALCAWLALGARVFLRGVGYSGGRLRKAANSQRDIERRTSAKPEPVIARTDPEGPAPELQVVSTARNVEAVHGE